MLHMLTGHIDCGRGLVTKTFQNPNFVNVSGTRISQKCTLSTVSELSNSIYPSVLIFMKKKNYKDIF